MAKKTLAVVGLGLMGGSFALGIQKATGDYRIVGYDHNKQHLQDALELGIIEESVNCISDVQRADVIVLAVPVDAIIDLVQTFDALKSTTTVIDLGSTKAKISTSIPQKFRANYVTSHPMTGTEKFGPSAAFDTLYEGKVVVVCDIEKSGTLQQEVACKLFELLQMEIVYMQSYEHDRHAAFISHMPHAVSYALANAVMQQEDRKSIIALAGGGFKDMSRIAKSNPAMWEDIFRQNKHHLIEAIESFEKELQRCRNMVENEKWDALHEWMRHANMLHEIL